MEVLKEACSQPYGNKVTDKSIQHIIESGHLSVLEHCYATFRVECSARVLGQLTRHRHLSFTCKSARGGAFQAFINPTGNTETSQGFQQYLDLLNSGMSYENAAYWMPQGMMTSLVVTGNFRAWFEYLPKRLCRRAMSEHRQLARDIQELLADAAPEVFDRNFMNCKNCKERSCSFK